MEEKGEEIVSEAGRHQWMGETIRKKSLKDRLVLQRSYRVPRSMASWMNPNFRPTCGQAQG